MLFPIMFLLNRIIADTLFDLGFTGTFFLSTGEFGVDFGNKAKRFSRGSSVLSIDILG